jgi:hypothetical protein
MWAKPLRYALPLAQMALGVVLIQGWYSWLRAGMAAQAPSPDHMLLLSINAPVSLARALWHNHVPDSWDNVAFILAIGIFWYWVALNILSLQERKALVLFRWAPLRIAADVLFIAMGACMGWWLCISTVTTLPTSPLLQLRWPCLIPVWASVFIWSLASVFLPTHDLIRSFRTRPARASDTLA